MPGARGLARRARAAHLLVQLAARRLPSVHRARRAARDRPRPARPRHVALDPGRRARAVDDREPELLRQRDRGRRRPLRDLARHAVAGPDDRAAGPVPVRDGWRQGLRHVPEPDGAEASVHDGVRGARVEPPAALPGDGLLAAARSHRGVHELPRLPRVRRCAAQAGGARGHDRRAVDPRVLAALGHGGAPLPRRARAHEDRGADRAAHREGGARAPDVPRQRRRRLPPARPRREDALGRRGPAPQARDADRLATRRRPLHPRRALDRAPPARQRQAHRDPRAAARPRQHRARRRARRADDAVVGLARGHGAGRRGARGRGRGRGHRGHGRGDGRLDHRRSSSAASAGSRCRRGAARTSAAGSACAARRCTT